MALHKATAPASDGTFQKLGQVAYLNLGQHSGNPALLRRGVDSTQPGQVDAQYLAVQKPNGAERLIVGRDRHFPLVGQHIQKRIHLCHAHVVLTPHFAIAAMPSSEKMHSMQVSLFGTEATVKLSTRNWSKSRVERKTGVPGLLACWQLFLYTVHYPKTQASSHFQEDVVTRISRIVRCIPQVLLDTLR